MIDISIIIVNWNTRELLLNCIESLYKTTKQTSLEIIVVDNASTDNSVDALQKKFPQVHIIVNPDNFGFAKANNIGLMQSKGRFVCLINSDVKAMDGVLDKMYNYMKINPEIGALAPKIYRGDMTVQKSCREFPTVRNTFCEEFLLNKLFPAVNIFRGRDMLWMDYDSIFEVEVLSGCFLMIPRQVIDQVGVLDDRFFFYSEDVDWCKRIHQAGWKLLHYPGAKAIHYGQGSSSSEPIKFRLEMLKANWQYWNKHKSNLECFLFRLIKLTGSMGKGLIWLFVSLIPSNEQATAKESLAAYRKMLSFLISPNKRTGQ